MLAPIVPSVPDHEPGERARENGIYRVVHDSHRQTHSVTILKGDIFPRCHQCGDRVRYRLWLASDYLTRDWDSNVKGMGLIPGGRSAANKLNGEKKAHRARVHSVHIYGDDAALISRLRGIVSSSLRVGDAVLIVATPEHRLQLVSELKSLGIDVRSHAREGRFTMVDANEALSTFMVNGMPDAELFSGTVGALLADARKRSQGSKGSLTVFGEMVAVLWEEGNKAGAIALEEMWNDALNQGAFHLHCAYPRAAFTLAADQEMVCRTHSHVIH